jgi:hypothetical protein
MQALKFERYECMGFTYWASGLQQPQQPQEPADTGRLTLLQSVFLDLHSLLSGDSEQGVQGPLDFLSAQAQVRSKRLTTCGA